MLVSTLAFTAFRPLPTIHIPSQIVKIFDVKAETKAIVEKIHNKTTKWLPAVVRITTIDSKLSEWAGSGFIITDDGYIVTNDHVVKNGMLIIVYFSDGTGAPAAIVGEDKEGDIALIKVNTGKKYIPVKFGNEDEVEVGDEVTVIGNPAGLGFSVSRGIVANPEKFLHDSPDKLIQVTASINPGNSGGPIFDAEGNVIGMSTMIIEIAGGELGFGISSNDIQWVISKIRAGVQINRATIGIRISNHISNQRLFCENCMQIVPDGVLVVSSNNAVILAGDIIKEVEGKEIKNAGDLVNAFRMILVGDKVTITVEREGKTVKLMMVAGRCEAPTFAKVKPAKTKH